MSAYVVLDDFLPLVLVRRVGNADLDAVRAMLGAVDGHLAHTDRKLALVYDAGDAPEGRPDAPARKFGGEWIRERQGLLRRRCSGIDFAFASALSRGALTAVFWIATPPVPVGIHSTCRAAIDAALKANGTTLDVDAVLDALARRV